MVTILSMTVRIDNVVDGAPPERRTGRRPPRRSVCVMAELKDRLRADLTSAMKSQDKLRTATLRLVLAAIQN
jgi:hypothetical protein